MLISKLLFQDTIRRRISVSICKFYLPAVALLAVFSRPLTACPQATSTACAQSSCPVDQSWQLQVDKGAAALQAGNATLAEHDFEIAAAKRPGAVQAWMGLGVAQQKLGLLGEAEDSFRKAHMLDPGLVEAITDLANVLSQEKLFSAAIVYWKQAYALQPQNAGIKFSLGKALLDSGDNQGAADLFRELTTEDTDRGPVWMDLGTALARLGQYDEASRMYLRAMNFPATADAARLALIKAMLTLLHYTEAQPYTREYLRAHPDDYEALYFNGVVDRETGKLNVAEHEFAAAVATDPGQYDGQLSLASILRQQGKAAEAIPHFLQALQLKPDSKAAHFQLARAYSATGQPELAHQQDAALQQQDSQDTLNTQVIVLDNKAAAALARHDTDLAIQTYQQISQLDPRNARVLYDLSMIYIGQGKKEAGRNLLQQAHQLDPRMAEVNLQLGYMDISDGRMGAAEAELGLALQENPQSAEALSNLGVLYARQGQMDHAIHLLRQAVDIDGKYEQGHLNLGLVLASDGQLKEAYKEIQQAVAIAPENVHATEALAAVKERMGSANF